MNIRTLITLFALCTATLAKAQQVPSGFWLGNTTGPLPHLTYGLGEDRLGGAKMTYLDSNVVMCVVDSTRDVYKIQLSKNHFAYAPKTTIRRNDSLRPQPYYLSENWRVFGDSLYDYVTINLTEKLPYRSIQQLSPSRLAVDIFGATSNSNWITQLKTTKEIKNVYYEQIEDDVLRVYIELKHKQHWGHHIAYDTIAKRLEIRIKRQPPLNLARLKIAIDPGHGGTNRGAEGGRSNILEKTLTLQYAKVLKETLEEAGVKHVFMTRTKDTTLSMAERAAMLFKDDPDVLISIHFNSAASDTVSGTSTYYRYIGFRPLSTAILDELLELNLKNYGNVGSFNFGLNGPTEYPNALVEVGFLSNREEEKRILDPNFRKRVAARITKGIRSWLLSLQQ
ncbi:N-acetylmuramoyl-L-alanine amidase [Filimonas effusa]|uniref:N-acetylmuramoyl-L-alanine amidase n=1 Tax=Filimonas effusa TaxID=2508721 RepID=A0A4V1M9F3_9BACT|nr:N-acetylmuramoyl-L-alanine amidase [Filimonas effusa]RXK80902.1 N-acetylmuramoyl-L-alanine amidase [Filimonas effusa]